MSYAGEEEPIAVISHSCRFPGANNSEEFWDVLIGGVDATSEVPPERPYAEEIRSKHIKRGGFLKCPVDSFDATFFNITADKAVFLDPQQRLLLEVVWECLEKAGIDPHGLQGISSTGVFVGVWSNDYRDILHKHPSSFTTCEYHIAYLSFALGVTAARISYFLGLQGPHSSVDAGCCSSLYSVHQAVSSLRQGECSLAIAGGVNLILHPAIGKLNSLVLAPDGRCKSFDAGANGFGRAEGCGVILLKRLSDAVRDGNKILGVIRGIAVNADATSATFGTPCRKAQAKTITEALRYSGLGPESISYVEAHGTGTEVGDTVEISAISSVYSTKKREKDSPLIISSAKPNIGHCEAAAGMASIIKVLLVMKYGIIPPHLNFKTPHPCIDLKSIPAVIPTVARKWNPCKRIAGISTFGLGGHNAHMIIEEPPLPQGKYTKCASDSLERPLHVLTLSAKCESALKQMTSDYVHYLQSNDDSIGNICYTANTGRAHFPYRLAVVGKSAQEISKKLEENDFSSAICKLPKKTAQNSGNRPKIAFLFSDHTSSNYEGIFCDFYETHPVFKKSFDECCDLAGIAVSKVRSQTQEKCAELPVLFAIQYSLYKLWCSFGIKPNVVLGYGFGEYAASVVSGKSSLEATMKILVENSKLLDKLPDAMFLAVCTSEEKARKLIEIFLKENRGAWLDISAINSQEEVVVVGESDCVNAFADFCENNHRGCNTRWVADYKAIHSKLAENILQESTNISNSSGDNDIEFISCATNGNNILSSSVNFCQGFSHLWASDSRVFIEIGPNPAILGLAMANCLQNEAREALWLPTLRKCDENWNTILSSLSKLYLRGVDIDWKGFDQPYDREILDDLPTYPFQRKRFWVQ